MFSFDVCDISQSSAPPLLHLLSFPLTSFEESAPEVSLLFSNTGRINLVKYGQGLDKA